MRKSGRCGSRKTAGRLPGENIGKSNSRIGEGGVVLLGLFLLSTMTTRKWKVHTGGCRTKRKISLGTGGRRQQLYLSTRRKWRKSERWDGGRRVR